MSANENINTNEFGDDKQHEGHFIIASQMFNHLFFECCKLPSDYCAQKHAQFVHVARYGI